MEAIQGKRADTAAIHREETAGKTCVDCHYNLVHRPVPDQSTFKREAWNRMIEEEFGLAPGMAGRMMADD
jgi:nitrate/TMAO reductase-like tetraheme cytochrome c subunit